MDLTKKVVFRWTHSVTEKKPSASTAPFGACSDAGHLYKRPIPSHPPLFLVQYTLVLIKYPYIFSFLLIEVICFSELLYNILTVPETDSILLLQYTTSSVRYLSQDFLISRKNLPLVLLIRCSLPLRSVTVSERPAMFCFASWQLSFFFLSLWSLFSFLFFFKWFTFNFKWFNFFLYLPIAS